MTSFEHRELRGITIRSIIVTIVSTTSIVATVMTSYLQIKGDLRDMQTKQEAQTRVNEIRLKVLEGQVALLEREVEEIRTRKF
ncbi:hypothetical protein DYU05_08965 [Mucilaginibacter terrenus]|uniref:Uncharacterized protein n=1 Tax=Mucilaginibacter terrenus TaxID=2482727 RepID=A0A3E2NXX5_9SPHI|nr:hypothetical protein [Mucilaginibacter terrenus]RFZ85710.1 hypothetical protein DYU05_08965 [Mucilaginibacter terrenus]